MTPASRRLYLTLAGTLVAVTLLAVLLLRGSDARGKHPQTFPMDEAEPLAVAPGTTAH